MAKLFNQLLGIWKSDVTLRSSLSYYVRNECLFKDKIRFKIVETVCSSRSDILRRLGSGFFYYTHAFRMSLRSNELCSKSNYQAGLTAR